MKIALLGTGTVAIELAKGFISQGHSAIFGTRDARAENALKALEAVPGSTALTHAQAADQADLAVLATIWSGAENAVRLAGEKALSGKVLIDVTNPLDFSSGKPRLALGFPQSGGSQVQGWLPQTRVVKAFNTIGAAHMVNPRFSEGKPDMFIAGNDATAKQTTADIARAFGWRSAIDMGDITQSHLLESLAMLWIEYGVTRDHWQHGFSLLDAKLDA